SSQCGSPVQRPYIAQWLAAIFFSHGLGGKRSLTWPSEQRGSGVSRHPAKDGIHTIAIARRDRPSGGDAYAGGGTMNEAVQTALELSKVLGLIIGGLWAAWTFKKLQKARSAELDNNKKLLEQRDLVTRALRQQPQLAVRLCVTETAAFADKAMSVISIAAILKNEGERNMMIEFGHAPL